MASLAELMVKVGADISDFSRQMNTVTKTMEQTGQGLMNVGKSVGRAGQQMASSVSLPILALGTTAVVVGAKFDEQMSKVSAVSGATGKDFEKLRDQAKELGSTTVWSASEAGQGMEFLARAGWKTEQIMSAMPSMLDLATASATDLGTTADITSNIMSGFGMSASEAGRMADVLAKTTASSNTDMIQLGDAMKYVAPVAKTFGWSIEETAGAIGKMSDAGIQGSQAGTTLRMGLLRLASPTKEMKTMMGELGMSFFDAEGKMKSMPDLIGELQTKTAGMTDEQKAHTLATMFGAEAVSGFMALMDVGADNLAGFTGELENSEGQTQKMADTMSNNLAGSFKGLMSALEGLAISFADVMAPTLRKVTDFLTVMTQKFDGLSPSVKKVIVIGGLLLASLAPLLIVIGLVAQGVGALMVAFGAISAPVLAVIAVIVAVGVAFVALYAKSETFRNGITKIFETIKDKISKALDTVVKFSKSKLQTLQKFWEDNGKQVMKAVENAFNFVKKIIDFVMPAIEFVVKMVWNSIKNVINGALNVIMGAIKIFAGLFTGDWSKLWEGVKQFLSGAVEAIWGIINLSFFGKVLKGITTFAKGALSSFKTWGSNVKTTVKEAFDSVKSRIIDPITSAKKKVLGIIDDIKSAFSLMKITIPKPKLPKISVSMRKGVMGIPYPDFDVNWNAKGGIYNGASILGGGQGVGEAGAEAVLPIQHKRYMAPFAKAVSEHLDSMNGKSEASVENHFQIAQLVVREEADVERIAQKLYEKQKRTNRGGGR